MKRGERKSEKREGEGRGNERERERAVEFECLCVWIKQNGVELPDLKNDNREALKRIEGT